MLAPMLAPTKRRHDDVTVASPHTEQGERHSARMPPSPRSDHRSVRPRLGDDASSPWARCASVLRIALEAMPYGDAPPAEVSNGKVTGGLSVGQLLNWGDKLQAGDSPKPSEEVLLRWSSHTLNTLAAANRSRTAVALRAVADSIEASPPDACLLPPRLLLRYGPSALRHQLLAIPDAAAGDDLGNLVGWMRVAAGVYDVADRAAGWQRILAGLGATPAAPAPPDAPDGGVGAPQEAAAANPPPPGPREGCFSAKGRAVRDPDAPPLSLPALSEAAALADEVTGSPPTSPHTPPPHTPHTPPPSPDQQQGHLRDASSPSAAQLLKMVAAPGLVAEVHTSLHDGPAVAGGAEARHWRVCARVRCVSREARTVSRILVAEQAPHGDFELPPAEARKRQAPGTSSGAVFGAGFGAATGAAATGAAADSYGTTLGRLCTRDTTFAQPVKLAGARRFFGSGGGHLELVSKMACAEDDAALETPAFVITALE